MELKTSKKIKIKNIRLNIHQVPHHGNNYIRNTDHFVYKIKLADKILIHTGDARKYSFDWKSIDFSKKKIEALIAPFGSQCSNWAVRINGNAIPVIKK